MFLFKIRQQEYVTEQEKKQRKFTENQRRCRMVQKRQPGFQLLS